MKDFKSFKNSGTFVFLLIVGACTSNLPQFKLEVIEEQVDETLDLHSKVVVLLTSQDTLVVDRMPGYRELSSEEKEDIALPTNTLFSIKTYYAGAGAYYYGLLQNDSLTFWNIEFNEEGDRFDKEQIGLYTQVEGHWKAQEFPKINTWLDYRNQNWKPEKGNYYFAEQYLFSFVNETHPEGDPRREGNFSFYLDPVTGTVLLVSGESFVDEMTRWILVRPNKDYIRSYSQEHGGIHTDTLPLDAYLKSFPKKYNQDVKRSFNAFFEPVPDTSTLFSTGTYCIEKLEARAYKVDYQGGVSSDQTILHLAETPYDWNALNLLYKSDALPELGLKINITGTLLPKNLLLVQEQSLVEGKTIAFQLECIQATEYHLTVKTPYK
jgi:hypothetical protein